MRSSARSLPPVVTGDVLATRSATQVLSVKRLRGRHGCSGESTRARRRQSATPGRLDLVLTYYRLIGHRVCRYANLSDYPFCVDVESPSASIHISPGDLSSNISPGSPFASVNVDLVTRDPLSIRCGLILKPESSQFQCHPCHFHSSPRRLGCFTQLESPTDGISMTYRRAECVHCALVP
jgi:hypothetical protein